MSTAIRPVRLLIVLALLGGCYGALSAGNVPFFLAIGMLLWGLPFTDPPS